MLFKKCKKMFLLLAETTEILQLYALVLSIVKIPHWYQMNPNVFLYNTAFSVQFYYIAGLSL